MLQSIHNDVRLRGVLAHRRELDRAYLMSLQPAHLLLPYYHEAAIARYTFIPHDIHDGWDSPLSMIRGTVCSHWLLTAAAMYQETGDMEVKARADYIVSEIARCQAANGGEWCFSIPENT